MTMRAVPALAVLTLLGACAGRVPLDQRLYDLGVPGIEAPVPPPPPPLPPQVVAALPPGAPQSTVIRGDDGCYLFSVEVTEPVTGYPIRDANGAPICDSTLAGGPVPTLPDAAVRPVESGA